MFLTKKRDMEGHVMMESKMYLVTGAAGFLGSTICRQLVEDDSQKVRALVLPGDKSAEYLPEGIEVMYGVFLFSYFL